MTMEKKSIKTAEPPAFIEVPTFLIVSKHFSSLMPSDSYQFSVEPTGSVTDETSDSHPSKDGKGGGIFSDEGAKKGRI
jgi:hypothetical protein